MPETGRSLGEWRGDWEAGLGLAPTSAEREAKDSVLRPEALETIEGQGGEAGSGCGLGTRPVSSFAGSIHLDVFKT